MFYILLTARFKYHAKGHGSVGIFRAHDESALSSTYEKNNWMNVIFCKGKRALLSLIIILGGIF